MVFKNRRKGDQKDLNHEVHQYQRWWQDQTEELTFTRSKSKEKKKSARPPAKRGEGRPVLDDSFVYYQGN